MRLEFGIAGFGPVAAARFSPTDPTRAAQTPESARTQASSEASRQRVPPSPVGKVGKAPSQSAVTPRKSLEVLPEFFLKIGEFSLTPPTRAPRITIWTIVPRARIIHLAVLLLLAPAALAHAERLSTRIFTTADGLANNLVNYIRGAAGGALSPCPRRARRDQVALGHTNREIAVTLGVTDETVKTHVARVLGKLQVENRAQAIVQALKRGLVTLEGIS
jgi:hypothetical protein